MNGVVNMEFILSVVVFLGTLSFITLTIGRDALSFREGSLYNSLKTNAIEVSNILVFDKGSPENWELGGISAIKRLGLSTGEKYVLSKEKIAKLNELCRKTDTLGTPNLYYKQNYEKIKELLNQKGEINLTLATQDGKLLDCSPDVETLQRPKLLVSRIATVLDVPDKKIAEFNITLID